MAAPLTPVNIPDLGVRFISIREMSDQTTQRMYKAGYQTIALECARLGKKLLNPKAMIHHLEKYVSFDDPGPPFVYRNLQEVSNTVFLERGIDPYDPESYRIPERKPSPPEMTAAIDKALKCFNPRSEMTPEMIVHYLHNGGTDRQIGLFLDAKKLRAALRLDGLVIDRIVEVRNEKTCLMAIESDPRAIQFAPAHLLAEKRPWNLMSK